MKTIPGFSSLSGPGPLPKLFRQLGKGKNLFLSLLGLGHLQVNGPYAAVAHFGVASFSSLQLVGYFPSIFGSSLYFKDVSPSSVKCLSFYFAYDNVFSCKIFCCYIFM